MSNFGESFIYPDSSYFRVWHTAMGPVSEDSSDYNDKTVLFSCVDIDRGWDWLHTLKDLYDLIHADAALQDVVAVAALVFRYNGSVTPTTLRSSIAADTVLNTIGSDDDFYIIADKTWSSSLSQTRAADFSGDIGTAADNVYWNYIIGKSSVATGENANPIMDIWSRGTGTLTLYNTTKQEFDSAGAADIPNYVTGRLQNLSSPARLVCPDPPDGTWLRSLTGLTMSFTKPVRQSQAQNASNWSVTGGGSDNLSFASASPQPVYDKTGNPHSIVTMTLNDGLRDNQADKEVSISAEGIQDVYGNDPEPETTGGTLIKSPVSYHVDLSAPTIDTFDRESPQYMNTLSVDWTLEASDPANGGVAFRCIKINPTDPDPDNDSLWTSYDGASLSGSTPLADTADGDQTVYAWVKDTAGNRSERQDISLTLDRSSPTISSFTPPAVSKSRTVSVTFTASDAVSGIAAWAVTESSTAPAPGDWNTTGIADPSFTVEAEITSANDGTKTLYGWVKDGAGNISEGTHSDTMLLDTNPPVVGGVTVGSYPRTDNRNVSFTVAATDPAPSGVSDVSGVAEVKFSNTDDITSGSAWEAWSSGHSYTHTVDDGWGERSFYVWVRDGAGNTSGSFQVTVTLQRRREIYLVLDYSGSMLSEVIWEGTDTPKIEVLRTCADATTELMSLWESVGQNDRIGVIKFHNTIFPLDFDGQETGRLLQGVEEQNTGTLDLLSDFLDEGCDRGNQTGMGAGLAEALNRLDYSETDESRGSRRAVFLISDGIQNRLPCVKATGSGTDHEVLIDDTNPEGLSVYGDTGYGNIPVHFTQSGAGGSACYPLIYTLGIGTSAAWQETLESTAAAGGGIHTSNPETLDAAETFLNSAVQDIYADASPQLVFSTRIDYNPNGGADESTYRFIVNKSATSLAVKLVWTGSTDLTYRLWKGSTLINQYDGRSNGDWYQVSVLRFPHSEWTHIPYRLPGRAGAGRLISPHIESPFLNNRLIPFPHPVDAEGEWSIQILPRGYQRSKKTVPFYLSIFVEETALEFDLSQLPSSITTGQELAFDIGIFEHQQPLPSQYSITTTIKKPKIPFGNLVSEFSLPNFEELYQRELKIRSISRGAFKTELLFRNEELREKALAIETEEISCVSQWKRAKTTRKASMKARFTGSTSNTKTPGIYQVEMDIRGTGKKAGPYQRMFKRTVLVKFKPDLKSTMASSKIIVEGKTVKIFVVPKDAHKNLLGTGWEPGLIVFMGAKRIPCEDQSDGSYRFDLEIPSSGKFPTEKIKITIMKSELFEGSLEELVRELKK